MKSLLVSTFVKKYGKVKGNKEFISKEVNALLKSGKITKENLEALEDKIKARLKIVDKAPSVHS
jgi:chaperonin cofactor prefoldin